MITPPGGLFEGGLSVDDPLSPLGGLLPPGYSFLPGGLLPPGFLLSLPGFLLSLPGFLGSYLG